MSGLVRTLTGEAAEDRVAALYARSGRSIVARRWRVRGGEIDIVARDGDAVVFVEVKQSADHARAAESLRPAQIRRLMDAASIWIADEPAGQDTEVRFDVALVDAAGRIEILANAFGP